ncbi:MAG: site-2 protease family protein [Vulcanimicrobiota bacterium]
MKLTRQLETALQAATTRSLELGHSVVSSGHLLWALTAQTDCGAYRCLGDEQAEAARQKAAEFEPEPVGYEGLFSTILLVALVEAEQKAAADERQRLGTWHVLEALTGADGECGSYLAGLSRGLFVADKEPAAPTRTPHSTMLLNLVFLSVAALFGVLLLLPVLADIDPGWGRSYADNLLYLVLAVMGMFGLVGLGMVVKARRLSALAPNQCRHCGFECAFAAAFSEPGDDGTVVCRKCQQARRRRTRRLVAAGWALVGLLAVAATVGGQTRLTGFLWLLLCLPVAAVLHELGHLLMARLLGFRPWCIHLGFGPMVIRGRWKELEVTVSAFPFTGYPELLSQPGRWRWSLYLTGGMLANAAALSLTWPQLYRFQETVSPLPALAAANLVMLAIAVLPLSYTNDGKGGKLVCEVEAIVGGLTKDLPVLANARQVSLFHRYLSDCRRQRIDLAAGTLAALETLDPDQPLYQVLRANLELWRGRFEVYLEAGPRVLELDLPEVEKADIHSKLAWAHLYHDENWDRAARHLAAARAITPGAQAALQACLDFRQGKTLEARSALGQAMRRTERSAHLASLACYAALFARLDGHSQQAESFVEVAEHADPKCSLLAAIRDPQASLPLRPTPPEAKGWSGFVEKQAG